MPRSYASDLLVDGIDLGAQRALVVSERPSHRRSDMFMVMLALAASAAVLANAFVFQDGRRESGGTSVPAPAAARRPASAPPTPPTAPPAARVSESAATPAPAAVAPLPPAKPPAPKPAAKVEPVAITPPASVPATPSTAAAIRPPADMAVSARVVEVQKALARLGYGPLRIDGRASDATEKAIKDFERDRRLPVTGQVSDRLVRELNAVAGFSIQ